MAAIQPRPTPLHPTVDTWAELDAYLIGRIADFSDDLDGEEAGHIGWDAQQRSRGRLAMLSEIRMTIAPAVAAEAAEQARVVAEDTVDAAYKAAGFSGVEPLMQRLMDGDR